MRIYSHIKHTFKIASICAALMLFSSGCLGLNEEKSQATTTQKPAPKVSVKVAKEESVPHIIKITGRVTAPDFADIRPQITGLIAKKHFKDGSFVKKDETLYTIDQSSYIASRDQAKALLRASKQKYENAKTTFQRYEKLIKSGGVSKQDYDNASSAYKEALESLRANKAALQSAQIELNRTLVKAPINGKLTISNYNVGELVSPSMSTPLITLQKLDPIYADFNAISKYAHKFSSDKNQSIAITKIDSNNTQSGDIVAIDYSINEYTDTLTLRAKIKNDKLSLLPGEFIKGEVKIGEYSSVVLVPSHALLRDPKGNPYAFILKDDNTVASTPIKSGGLYKESFIALNGLKDGDKIITQGLQYVRAGAKAQIENVEK